MQRFLILMLAVLAGLLPAAAHAWWQPDWNYRKQISIDTTTEGAAIAENIGRTPMLVRLHTGNFAFDGVNENGSDIRFVTGDDTTVLNHQIESFDPLMGMALIWVDVTDIAADQRQDIWMYYGNEAAPATGNGQLTFDPNYILTYHFDGAAGAPPRDTTAYSNHAQTPVTGSVDGVIGRAAQFTGEAPLMLPASPSLALPAASAFTFSAWVRADQPAGEQLIYARRDAGNSLLIGLDQSVPFVEVNGERSQPGQPVSPATWQHLALSSDGTQTILYVNGRAAATLAVSLPPLSTVTAIGGDVPGFIPAAATAGADSALASDEATPATEEQLIALDTAAVPAASTFTPFTGAIDELRISKVARPAALILADATAQGSESRLVVYGVDEKQSGFGFGGLGFLINAIPLDAWIILAILAAMMVQSWVIMYTKNRNVARVSAANGQFREAFSKVGQHLEALADDSNLQTRLADSALWRLYQVAINEIRIRRSQGVDVDSISGATIESIRASMDAVRTKENQKLGAKLGILSNAIAGALHWSAGYGAWDYGRVPGHSHGG
ncbi:DUF2341 domain-containing protein [Paenalcaligenes niemegkensis]|uniref:DUF2341 domain-containing protein n=1 Tax=Paenalcaligenes niemegkensis TaxID=2895469 RepID=UPI00356280CC